MIVMTRRYAATAALTIAALAVGLTLAALFVVRVTGLTVTPESQGSAREVLVNVNGGWAAVGFDGWRPYVHAERDPRPALPECVTEDSPSCVWHAERHGNGLGVSFVADDQGGTHPFADRTARCVLDGTRTVYVCTPEDGAPVLIPVG
jgi:hypothetical protein